MIGQTIFGYYVMTSLNEEDGRVVLLENGKVSIKAHLADNVNFPTTAPCLVLVGHEDSGRGSWIFTSRVIALDVDKPKVCTWLSGLATDDNRDSFTDAIGIITLIKDPVLRSNIISVIFDECLNPWGFEELDALTKLYENITAAGEFVHHYSLEMHSSQYEEDMYLTVGILQLIMNSHDLTGKDSNTHLEKIRDLMESQLKKVFHEAYKMHYMNFYEQLSFNLRIAE